MRAAWRISFLLTKIQIRFLRSYKKREKLHWTVEIEARFPGSCKSGRWFTRPIVFIANSVKRSEGSRTFYDREREKERERREKERTLEWARTMSGNGGFGDFEFFDCSIFRIYTRIISLLFDYSAWILYRYGFHSINEYEIWVLFYGK